MRSSTRARPLLVLGLVAAGLLILVYWAVGRSSSTSSSTFASLAGAADGARAKKSALRERSSLKCLFVGPDANADANPAALLRPLVLSANKHMPKARLVLLVPTGAAAAKQSVAEDGEEKEKKEKEKEEERPSVQKQLLGTLASDRAIEIDVEVLEVAVRHPQELARFEALHQYLASSSGEECTDVLLSERVDVIFQQDAFAAATAATATVPKVAPNAVYFTAIQARSDAFGANSRSSALLHKCVGEKVLHRLAAVRELFAGVVVGTRTIMITYVRAMESLLGASRAAAAAPCISQASLGSSSSGSGSGITSIFHHVVLRYSALGDALPDALSNERNHLQALISALRLLHRDEQALVLDVEAIHSFNVDASGVQVRAGDAHDRPLPALLYGHRRSALLAQLLTMKYALVAPAPAPAPAAPDDATHQAALPPPAKGSPVAP